MKGIVHILLISVGFSSCISRKENRGNEVHSLFELRPLEFEGNRVHSVYPMGWLVDTAGGIVIRLPNTNVDGTNEAMYAIQMSEPGLDFEEIVNETKQYLLRQNAEIRLDRAFVDRGQKCHLIEVFVPAELNAERTDLISQLYYRQREEDILKLNFTFHFSYYNQEMLGLFNEIWRQTY